MRRSILIAALAAAAAMLAARDDALAQQSPQIVVPLIVGADPMPEAASPGGAVFIPGVGFRYVAPGGPRVYGYRAYGSRVYSSRARAARRACRDRDWLGFDRCRRDRVW
jgi:hypothetical protein